MLSARLCGHLNRVLSATEKYHVTSVHFSNRRCIPLISKWHTSFSRIPQLTAVTSSKFRCQQKDSWETSLENSLLLSACSNQLPCKSSSSGIFTSLLQRPLYHCCPSVVTSLFRGFHSKQRAVADDEADEEIKQKLQQKDDESKDYAAWVSSP